MLYEIDVKKGDVEEWMEANQEIWKNSCHKLI